jgi:hypothetical protein
MKYLLLVYGDEKRWTDEYRNGCYAESLQLAHDLQAGGKYISASPLQPTTTAASVRIREGKRTVTDGPFAETREQLGGYYLIEAGSREEAIEIASKIPVARMGTIEVRPLIDLAGLPEEGARA